MKQCVLAQVPPQLSTSAHVLPQVSLQVPWQVAGQVAGHVGWQVAEHVAACVSQVSRRGFSPAVGR